MTFGKAIPYDNCGISISVTTQIRNGVLSRLAPPIVAKR
jgi:hypothetical protein